MLEVTKQETTQFPIDATGKQKSCAFTISCHICEICNPPSKFDHVSTQQTEEELAVNPSFATLLQVCPHVHYTPINTPHLLSTTSATKQRALFTS